MSLVAARHAGGIAVLELRDPERRNVLSPRMCADLSAAVLAAGADEAVKAVVIAGADPAFCAGADLADLKAAAAGEPANVRAVYAVFAAVVNCPLPTIAAVNGPAVGAGFNLALACDMRVAGPRAVFDTRFLRIGLHPGGGHGWMLLRAVGWAQAARMVLLGQPLDAAAALAAGLVQGVSEDDSPVGAAENLARAAERLPRELIVATKASLRLAASQTHAEASAHEEGRQMDSLGRPAFRELVGRPVRLGKER